MQPGGTFHGWGSVSRPASPPRHSISQLLGTYDALLGKFMPPGLLVSERGELVHAFSGASKFLQLRDGRQGLDVLDVVHPELRSVLIGALQRALKERPARAQGRARRAGRRHALRRLDRARRVPAPRVARARGLLVLFESRAWRADHVTPERTEVHLSAVSRERVAGLEQELSYTKENLQAAIEELQTSNEELQASNEELLASNEELQSTNEELQSVNEELYTVNAEYQRKIAELTELTNDMDNLLAAHGRRHRLSGQAAQDSQVHVPDREELQPLAPGRRAVDRDVSQRHRVTRSSSTTCATSCDRRAPSSARSRRSQAGASSCASCRTGRRAPSTASSSPSST